MTGELVAFLKDCLDEDEQRAMLMIEVVWPETVHVVPQADTGRGHPVGSVSASPGQGKAYARLWEPGEGEAPYDQGWRVHESAIEVWSPAVAARVLAEVAAKRRIIDLHEPREDIVYYQAGQPVREWVCPTCVYIGDDEDPGGNRFRYLDHDEAPCDTLRLLALPYAGHDGYRAEWAPDEEVS